jgi:hypothetical protein
MKNLIVYFQIIIAAVCFTNCAKEPINNEPITYGTIIESDTKKPIAGAKVYLSKTRINWLLIGSENSVNSSEFLDSTVTDREGKYTFTQKGDNVQVFHPDFFNNGGEYLNSKYTDGDYFVEMALHPKAYLKVTFRNESGAFGVYYPNEFGSSLLQLAQGQDSTVMTSLREGDKINEYQFDPRIDSQYDFPTPEDKKKIKVTANGKPVEIKGEFQTIILYLDLPRDTTNMLIVY